jgi:membrane protease YdiL (CAAX protease family)
MMGAQFIGYFLLFASLVLLLRVRYDAPFLPSMAWVMPKKGLWLNVAFGPMLAFTLSMLGFALQAPTGETPFKEMMTDRWSLIVIGLFGVTIGPLCEELAFRGFLMPVLVRSFGAWIGVLVTALPFALLHGPQYSWSWQHILLLTLAGCAFGGIRQITGSTAAAALTHATYNLTFFSALVIEGNR